MKKILNTCVLFFTGMLFVLGQTTTENYVKTTQYQTEITSETAYVNADDKIETITYYDGLGRPIQSLAIRAGGQKQTVYSFNEYDRLGRQSKKYLPLPSQGMLPEMSQYDFQDYSATETSFQEAVNGYYVQHYPEDAINSSTINAYSETVFEPSLINRVSEQGAPGNSWKVDANSNSDHTVKFEYRANTNADAVSRYRVVFPIGDTEAPTLVLEGFYPQNELFKTITKDENWSPDQAQANDHTIAEFKDKQGRVILKRTYANNRAHDTQYIYDDFGNLTYVLSPEGSDELIGANKIKNSNTSIKYPYFLPDGSQANGSGGTTVIVDSDQMTIAVNFDLNFNTDTVLKNGLIGLVDTQLPDMILGTISGSDYEYQVAIVNGYLGLFGSGTANSYQDTLVFDVPEVIPKMEILDALCYQYRYDSRNRLIEKKIPGKGWEYIIYDSLDRPVLTQDAMQRTNKTWMFTKYDVFGRIVYTGELMNLDDSRREFQERVTAQLVKNESPSASVNYGILGYGMFYTNNALQFPNAAVSYTDLFTINYYDSYNSQLTAVAANPNSVFGTSTTSVTKGLSTGSRVQVMDGSGNHWITTVSYYDDRGQVLYTARDNSYLDTRDVVETAFDFTGKVLHSRAEHTRANTTTLLEDDFTYDHAGRLLTQSQRVNNAAPELIVNNHYDALGQLIRKDVGGRLAEVPEVSTGLQTVDYTYNIRGWLKTMNDLNSLGNDLFSFKLNYHASELPLGSLEDPKLYNGNISETLWATVKDTDAGVNHRGYVYNYDALNRIVKGAFRKNGAGSAMDDYYNLNAVGYDKNGNILNLERSGFNASTEAFLPQMDHLRYKYSGNQLVAAEDYGDLLHGFKGLSGGGSYSYDANGNMTSDVNKNITAIGYNHLNLPTQVAINGGTISYIYDATGVKLQKKVLEGEILQTTDYAGAYIYKNNNLEYISQPEGYIGTNASGQFNYVYQYKDHLGNVRLNYQLDAESSVLIDEDYSGTTADYYWIGGPSVGSNVSQGELHFSAPNKWQNISKYLDINPNKTVHIEFDFKKGDMKVPVLFVKEKINGVWEPNSERDFFYLHDGHFEADLNLEGDHIRIYFEKGTSSDHGTLTTCHIDNFLVTQNVLEVLEENHYYPFGLKHQGYNDAISANANQIGRNFRFGGKEYQEDLALSWYDYGARNYDAALGRWMNVDVLSQKFESISPYVYVGNTPTVIMDPDGMDWYVDKKGNYHFNPELTKENAKDILKDGERHFKGAYHISHKNGVTSIHYLNNNGTVTDKNGVKLDAGSSITVGEFDTVITAFDDRPSPLDYTHKNGDEVTSNDGHNYVLHDNKWLKVETPSEYDRRISQRTKSIRRPPLPRTAREKLRYNQRLVHVAGAWSSTGLGTGTGILAKILKKARYTPLGFSISYFKGQIDAYDSMVKRMNEHDKTVDHHRAKNKKE